MGEYAELALEQEWEYEWQRRNQIDFRKFRYENSDRWIKKDGTIIAIKGMTDQHLLNSIAMLERSDHDYSDCPAYHGLLKEKQNRIEYGELKWNT